MVKTKILITGGAGFIGSHLADRFIENGCEVCVVDNLSSGTMENVNPRVKFYKIDICDPGIGIIFKKEKPQIVLHYAAQINVRKSIADPVGDARINILGSLNILENCRKTQIKKFVFASSIAVYGESGKTPVKMNFPLNPISPYGISKLAVEKYIDYYSKIFKLPYAILRFPNVYGPRQDSSGEGGVIAVFCNGMLGDREIAINGSGRQTRDFVFVGDVVEANAMILNSGKAGIFNVGTATETDVNAIFKKIRIITGSKQKERHVSPKKGEIEKSSFDFSKIKKTLGWTPKYDLDQGIKETVEWFRLKIAS